ncbi:fibroblast growth factor 1-like [Paramuricea clavata]|uniref:Fibroblast growth factor 1-like n=1 Tax=Paramuricea clavata TaxID=317549 RepID=A0A7D9HF93_PARCT|nr:fibroblast growth factor 1-like [Paramuricea clavata]
MCALKAILLFHFVVSAILITSTPSNAKRLRLSSNKKATSGYLNYINGLFSDRSIKRRPRHLSFKNNTPSGRMKVQLYCRTGFLLEILDSGRIVGTQNVSSEHTIIEIQVFGHILRRLRGVASGRYLSLSSKGRLSSTRHSNRNKPNTFFNEKHEENHWISYSSSSHTRNCVGWKKDPSRGNEWFIAIKKNGSLKRPCKTEPGMHSTQFVALEGKREAILVEENSLGTNN